jgi:hypothetical protein
VIESARRAMNRGMLLLCHRVRPSSSRAPEIRGDANSIDPEKA